MKYRIGLLTLLCFAFIAFPCSLLAQGGDVIKPPACCPEPEPPPPPPGGDSLLLMTSADSVTAITISDSELTDLGMTRTQFLDWVAATAFGSRAYQDYAVIIPTYALILTEDGTTAVRVTYVTAEASRTPPELLDTLGLVFITDGQTTIAVLFAQSRGPV